MRFDLDRPERTMVVSLLRDRASTCRIGASDAKSPRVKSEFQEEASFCDTLAGKIDAGEYESEPSRVDDRDLRQVDAPEVKESSNG